MTTGKNNNKLFGFILVIMFGLVACQNNTIYVKNYNFTNETWHKDSTLLFDVEINDTLQVYHVFFHTRITGQYPYSNLFLFIDTKFPNDTILRDTMECILAEPSGKWLAKPKREWTGKGFGHTWSNKIGYKTYIRFPYSGNYTFKIEQAMRTNELEHVLDAGLSIEKAKK